MVCGAQKGGADSIQLNFIETPHTAGGGLVARRGCGGARGGIRAEGGQEEAFREAGRTNPPGIRDRWQPLRHGRRSIRPQRAQHPFCPRSKSSAAGRRAGPGYSWSPSSGSRSQPGPARGPSRGAGCSACRSRAVAARRGRTHPFCPRSKSSPPFPLGPSRFSCPAQPGGVIRAEGPVGTWPHGGLQRVPKSRSDGLEPPPAVGEPCGGVRGRRQGPRAAAGGRHGLSEGVGGREAGWLHGLGVGRRGSRCLNALSQEAQNGESLNASLKSRTPVGKLPLQIVEVEAS